MNSCKKRNSRKKRAAAIEAIQADQKVEKKQRTETIDGEDSDYESADDPCPINKLPNDIIMFIIEYVHGIHGYAHQLLRTVTSNC